MYKDITIIREDDSPTPLDKLIPMPLIPATRLGAPTAMEI